MECLIGLSLALAVCLGATVAGLDRDRAFYPAVALAIGTYYLLFAVLAGSLEALGAELVAYLFLTVAAVYGFRSNLWLVVASLAGHGGFDLVHPHIITNAGVPEWWPIFCMSYDVTAALYLAWLLARRPLAARRPKVAHPISVYVQWELDAAAELESKPAACFHRLERAHVLSQASTREHVRVHWHMLIWGFRQRRRREVFGQILRIVGAATKTALGLVPSGNTGGANVSPFKSLPVSEDLAVIISSSAGGAAKKSPALLHAPD